MALRPRRRHIVRSGTKWTVWHPNAAADVSRSIGFGAAERCGLGRSHPRRAESLDRGALRLPARPTFAVGGAYFEILDYEEHKRTLREIQTDAPHALQKLPSSGRLLWRRLLRLSFETKNYPSSRHLTPSFLATKTCSKQPFLTPDVIMFMRFIWRYCILANLTSLLPQLPPETAAAK